MSSALAIASVTAVLKNLLDDGMIDDTIVGSIGNVKVSALAPDLIIPSADAPSQLNLFLYQVRPNLGWRNVGLPSRDTRGERLTNPPLALDLHYLMTAYSSRDLHAEILLGYAMQILHETPGLSRDMIRRGLMDPGLSVDPHDIPADLRALATSELDGQVENIKITPFATEPDDMTKLWTALQSKFRPSMAYSVSVVLIEAKRSTRSPLPVATAKIYVDPFRSPRIDRILSQKAPASPMLSGAPIVAGDRLVLRGIQLSGGDRTLVRIGSITAVPDASLVQDTQIIVPIPAAVNAGLQGVQVVQERLLGEPATPHTGVGSNLIAFLLRPQITNADMPTAGTLRLDITPPLDPAQQAVVFLNEIQTASPPPDQPPHAYTFTVPAQVFGSPPAAANEVRVPITGVEPGHYLIRLQVDGADSPVSRDAQGRYDQPSVTVT